MAFGGWLGNTIYNEIYSPMVRADNRVVRAAADVGSRMTGGYLKERAENLKHEANTNIESPNQAGWKALASYLAWMGAGGSGGSSGAAAEGGAGGAADASYYGAADAAGGLAPEYGSSAAYDAGLAGSSAGMGAGAGSTNPALIESGTGQEGYGASSASSGYQSPGDASFYQRMMDAGRGYFANSGYLRPAMGAFQMYSGLQNYQAAQERQRQQRAYAQQLQALMQNPGSVSGLPGYEAGLEAVRRSMAAQGYQGSGNMMAALSQYGQNAYNSRVQQLQQLQGADTGVGSTGNALMQMGSGLAMF